MDTIAIPWCLCHCVVQCLFQLVLWKRPFLWCWFCVKNILKCGLTWSVLNNEYASLFFPQTSFLYCFSMLREFTKVFEGKGANLHKVTHALSNPSFQLSTNQLSHSPSCTKFVDYRSWIINRLLDVLVCSITVYCYSSFVFWQQNYTPKHLIRYIY